MDKTQLNLGMVDVGAKEQTQRTAFAQAKILLGHKAYEALIKNECPKGNVLETAKIAGIMAVKNTPQIIPLCHPLEISGVKISFDFCENEATVIINSRVKYCGKTGVEMEALASVSAAALTIYDMMKWCDKGMVIKDIQLVEKTGGKSGDYHRDPS